MAFFCKNAALESYGVKQSEEASVQISTGLLVSQADVLRGREEERLVTIAAKMRTDGMFNLRCARA